MLPHVLAGPFHVRASQQFEIDPWLVENRRRCLTRFYIGLNAHIRPPFLKIVLASPFRVRASQQLN